MAMGLIYVIIFGVLVIASVILAIIVTKILNSDKSIELVGQRLENSDASISDAMTYLKITNEWNR
ncbi:MAG: hypothetical protein HDR01_03125 [Lachnospiraceae bacterium]|nr:hypothetical protein [Lachnospiraceae bacterium]